MKKKIVGLALSLLATASIGIPVYANQWQQDGTDWKYLDDNGNLKYDTWVESEGNWYYIGYKGVMLTDTLFESNDRYYYVDANGVMAKSTWLQLSDAETGEKHWYYFGADGSAYKGVSGKASTKLIDGKRYLFDTDGRMLTGFVDANGEVIAPEENNPFIEAKYYFGADGAMYQNQWLEYLSIAVPGASDVRSSLAQRDYNEYQEVWLYFGADGKKYTAKSDSASRLYTIGDFKYAFDENGVMMPKFSVKNANVTATASNATVRYGSLDTEGQLIPDRWIWAVPTDVMDEEEYHSQEFSWWRTTPDGKLLKDGIYSVYGRKYAFDALGRMQAGFVIMLDGGKFAIQYDVDEWERADFLEKAIDSPIPSIDRGNLYLFSADEFNDGSMQTGKEIYVQLNDELSVFGFKPNGKAYGNRCTLEKVNGKYYYNGLRLDADASLGYGIVDTDTNAGINSFVVVNTRGDVVKGSRKVVKDGAGNWIIIRNGKFFARVDDADKPRWRNGQFWHYDSSLKGAARYVAPIAYSEDNTGDGFTIFNH